MAAADYKDSKERYNAFKYEYILANQNSSNTLTYTYLKELKAAGYKDCDKIWDNLYAWKVTVVAINRSKGDTTTSLSTISRNTPVYFHIKLTGGEPNTSVVLRYTVKYSNGWSDEDIDSSRSWKDGSTASIYWEDGISSACTVTIYFYDDSNNLIGQGSVKIV